MKDKRWPGWSLADMQSLEDTIKWVVTTLVVGAVLCVLFYLIYLGAISRNQKNIDFLKEAHQLCPKGVTAYIQDYQSDHPFVVCK